MPFYVVSVGEKENQNHKIRESGYIAYQIAWCTKGKGVLILDGTQYEIDSGKGFYFAEGVPHEYYAAVQPWTLRWIAFNGNQTDYFFKFLKSPRAACSKKAASAALTGHSTSFCPSSTGTTVTRTSSALRRCIR